jgi:hypothetical protein
MPENLHPTAGIRILLELERSDPGGAEYRGAIYTPTERFDYKVHIALPDGAVHIADPATGPVDALRAMARSLARDALAGTPSDPSIPWPRRFLRWRPK